MLRNNNKLCGYSKTLKSQYSLPNSHNHQDYNKKQQKGIKLNWSHIFLISASHPLLGVVRNILVLFNHSHANKIYYEMVKWFIKSSTLTYIYWLLQKISRARTNRKNVLSINE